MHLICPPIKFGIRIIFNFSWEGGNENEKAKQNFGGQIKCIMEDGKWRIQQMCPKKIDNNYPVFKRVLSVAFQFSFSVFNNNFPLLYFCVFVALFVTPFSVFDSPFLLLRFVLFLGSVVSSYLPFLFIKQKTQTLT